MSVFENVELVLDEVPHDAALNMAIDEALLRSTAVALVRVYRWAAPAVSFGYFVKYDEVESSLEGRQRVRRWTGGGVVPHGDDFTFSVIVPRPLALARMAAPDTYRLIHAAVAASLADSRLAAASAPKVSAACFDNPAESDVLVGDRKVAGGAQRRTAAGLLHQGSIQHAALPADFAERFCAKLARRTTRRSLRDAQLEYARTLESERYGTEAWLRRF